MTEFAAATTLIRIGRHREMVYAMDYGVGRVVDALSARGDLDNTIIVFSTDVCWPIHFHCAPVIRRRMCL